MVKELGCHLNALRALLRCGSCRFAAHYWIPFAVAVSGGSEAPWLLPLGAVYWFLFSLGTELVNRLADRVEDEINHPDRTALCRSAGWERIRRLAVAIWVTVAAADVAWVLHTRNLILGTLLGLALCSSINYSVGPRLKHYRLFSLYVLTFPFAGTFITGLATDAATLPPTAFVSEVITDQGALILVVALFIVTLAGTKDISDFRGDEVVGFQSLFSLLVHQGRVGVLYGAVLLPFAACAALIFIGLLPSRFALLLAFAPVSLGIAFCVDHGVSPEERSATRELFHQYWIVFVSSSFLLYSPSLSTLAVVIAGAGYWLLTSLYLHWNAGPRSEWFKTIAQILGRREALPRSI